MKTIPIVFCVDENFIIPFGVSITSLLENAATTTFYQIFILHKKLTLKKQKSILELKKKYDNLSITFCDVGNQFKKSFEIRGITIAAYYRLLIPKLLPDFNKIIYADTDTIFQDDLSKLYDLPLNKNYLAGVKVTNFSNDYILNIKADPENYINSGVLLMNTELIRKDSLVKKFIALAESEKLTFQDQDILNIVCKGKILSSLHPRYNCYPDMVLFYNRGKVPENKYTQNQVIQAVTNPAILHYAGPKPWNCIVAFDDVWWQYFRMSQYYDIELYTKRNELCFKKSVPPQPTRIGFMNNIAGKIGRRVMRLFNPGN